MYKYFNLIKKEIRNIFNITKKKKKQKNKNVLLLDGQFLVIYNEKLVCVTFTNINYFFIIENVVFFFFIFL